MKFMTRRKLNVTVQGLHHAGAVRSGMSVADAWRSLTAMDSISVQIATPAVSWNEPDLSISFENKKNQPLLNHDSDRSIDDFTDPDRRHDP